MQTVTYENILTVLDYLLNKSQTLFGLTNVVS